MTIPGKGGRPRKWRSDADRVRAFRARQQGVAEPPLLERALQDGDEVARMVVLVGRLRGEVVELRSTIRRLRKELADAKRAAKADERRFGWIEARSLEVVHARLDVGRDDRVVDLLGPGQQGRVDLIEAPGKAGQRPYVRLDGRPAQILEEIIVKMNPVEPGLAGQHLVEISEVVVDEMGKWFRSVHAVQ